MNIRHLLPEHIVRYLRTLQAQWRYPTASINSGRICPGARIGVGCEIAYDVEVGPAATIGDYSYVNRSTIIGSATIGKFCSIGYYCQIGMPQHPVAFPSTSPRTYGRRNLFSSACSWDDFSHPPAIGSDVWIGSGAQVLQGVTIGDGAVVGAGTVVTKAVPPYSVVVGVPGRILRYRFDDIQIEALLRLRWWNLPLEKIKDLPGLFGTTSWDVSARCSEDENGKDRHS